MCTRSRALAMAAIGIVACCAVVMGVRGEEAPAAPLDPKTDIKAVLEGIKRGEEQVTSLKALYLYTEFFHTRVMVNLAKQRIGNIPAPGTDFRGVFPIVRRAGVAFSGARAWGAERESLPRPACGYDFYREDAFDGTVFTKRQSGGTLVPCPATLRVQAGPPQMTDLSLLAAPWVAYVLNIPHPGCTQLGKTLAEHTDAVVGGIEIVLGLPCYRIQSHRDMGKAGEFDYSWWIAPSRGYRCVRYLSEGKRFGTDERVQRWESYDGIWLPVQFMHRSWGMRDGREATYFYKYVKCEEMQVNTALPDSTFRVEPKLGDWVEDSTGKDVRRYVVGGDTNELEQALLRRDFPPEVRRDASWQAKP